MNSISMFQSNVDALPPPNCGAAILTELPDLKYPPPLSSQFSPCPNKPRTKRLAKKFSRLSAKKTVTLLGDAMLSRWSSYRQRLDECRNDPTMDSVHELRVSIRRLISQFVLINRLFTARRSEKACDFLKRQLESLGDLRDTHVQQIFFRRQAAKFPNLANLLARLQRCERSLVRRASGKIDRFKTKKLEKCVHYISQLIEHQSHGVPREIASIALQSANAAFAEVVERWRLIDRSNLRTIHRTRVAFKKFRYIVESLPPELTGFGKSDLRKLARYQRAMGNIQDFEVIQACVITFKKRHENVRLDSFCRYLKSRRARAVQAFLKKSDRLPQLWPPWEPLERQTAVVRSNTFSFLAN